MKNRGFRAVLLSLLWSAIALSVAIKPAHAATVSCPRNNVVMEGSTTQMGVHYTHRLEASKLSGGPGHNGRWKVTGFEQVITYPWDLKMAAKMQQPIDLGGGHVIHADCLMSDNKLTCRGVSDSMTLLVAGNRVQAEGTGLWNGKVVGNTMSFKFDRDNPLEPVMSGTIGAGLQSSVTLDVVRPEEKGRYVFAEDPSVLVMELEARTNPENYADSVEWEIPEVEGSKRTIVPAGVPAKGRKLTVVYDGLPDSYKAFGKKTVKANLRVGACSATEKRDVRFFYSRDAKNNPGGEHYNWFFYWRQTPAALPFGQFVNLKFGGTEFDLCTGEHVVAIFKPEHLFKAIHVCDLTKKLGGDFKITLPKVHRNAPSTLMTKQYVTYTHIDTFAVIVMHEFSHFNHYHTWWRGKPEALRNEEDKDIDGVPDRLEPAMKFDPKKYQTFWGDDPEFKDINGDEEFLAYESTFGYKVGDFDQYDWGKPGKNWE